MEDCIMIESKDYAQVIFDDVLECYSLNHNLVCSFNLSELIKADSNDWIGIFRVGFTNYKEFVCKQNIRIEEITQDFKGNVLFSLEELPKDDCEFYQFVYVSGSKQIRGASIPFQFKKSHLSDFIQVVEEAIVNQSKQDIKRENITEIKSRCDYLWNVKSTFENLLKENEQIIRCLKDELSSAKLRCLKLSMDNERLNFTLKEKCNNLLVIEENLSCFKSENLELKTNFEILEIENKNLNQSLKISIENIEKLKIEIDSLKQNEINKLDIEIKDRNNELENLKENLSRNEGKVMEQAKTIQNILLERDNLKNYLNKLQKDKQALFEEKELINQELEISRDKFSAAEQCKEMLRAQVIVLTNELNDAKLKLEKHSNKIQELTSNEKKLELEKDYFKNEIEILKNDFELKLKEANGSYYALKLAHTYLDSKLKKSEQSQLNPEQCLQKFKVENEELRERIKEGAKEYSKLLEKYRLIKNRQFNNDLNIYHDLNGKPYFKNGRNSDNTSSSTNISQKNTISNTIVSSFQDRSISCNSTPLARASSADIENTLLDALLDSSIYNQISNEIEKKNFKSDSKNLVFLRDSLSSSKFNDLNKNNENNSVQQTISDDGLVNAVNYCSKSCNENYDIFESSNKSESRSIFFNNQCVNHSNEEKIEILEKNYDKRNYVSQNESALNEIEQNFTSNYGPSCPVCFLQFRTGYPQNDFEIHVNSHFSN